jgi:hypothetical protein
MLFPTAIFAIAQEAIPLLRFPEEIGPGLAKGLAAEMTRYVLLSGLVTKKWRRNPNNK